MADGFTDLEEKIMAILVKERKTAAHVIADAHEISGFMELRHDEWEKVVRETANDLWDVGKCIRKHHDSSDSGHRLMTIASNLHRACGIMRGKKPLPAAGERLTDENTGISEKRKCSKCGNLGWPQPHDEATCDYGNV